MNSGMRYVLRNLRRRRLRTAAGVVGVFLTLALLTAIQVGLDSVASSYTDLVALQAGRADVVITAPGGDPLRPVAFDPTAARAVLAGHPELGGVTPRWVGLGQVSAGGAPHYALVAGVDPEAERTAGLWGLRPEPGLDGLRCALSGALAERLGVGPGAQLTITPGISGEPVTVQVETVLDRQLLVPQEVREMVVVGQKVARQLLGEPDRVHQLVGALREPSAFYDSRDLQASVRRLRELGESLAAELGMELEVRLPKATALTAFQNLASPLRAAFGVFGLLALSVTGLLVYSIVSVAVEERVREFGILRTLGARRGHIFRLVLGESALLCGLGVAPGVVAGVAIAGGLVTVIGLAMGGGAGTVDLAWSGSHLWLTLAVGFGLCLGSALLPAVQATRRSIIDALDPLRRGQVAPVQRAEGDVPRPWLLAGVGLSAVSVVVFFVLPTAFLSGDSSLIGTVVLGLLLTILLGFTLVAVSVVPWLEGAIMRVLGWGLGPAVELAHRNLRRHRRRNNTTVLMFVLSVALVLFVASLVALFSRTTMTTVRHLVGADLRLEADDPGTGGLREELEGMSGVKAVSEVRFLRSRTRQGLAYDAVLSDLVGLRHLWVVPYGVDAALPRVLFTDQAGFAEGGPEALPVVAGYEPGSSAAEVPPVILSQAAARSLDVRVGQQVQLALYLGGRHQAQRFRVEAVCAPLAGFEEFRARVAHAVGSGVLIPVSSFQELTAGVPAEARRLRYLLRTDGAAASEASLVREIRDRYDLRFRFGVKSVREQEREARVVYWTTQVFFGLLLVVAVTIAVFALIASMASSVLERRWEVGMLKALGLRRGQLFRMFLGEALGVTLSAGLAGGLIGFTLAWLFALEAGALAEIPVVFTLPYLTFVATLVISLGAGAVAAHLPTRRLLRMPAAEILRLRA